MITSLLSIIDSSQQYLIAGFIVFLRIGGVMAVLPAFGERSVPERIRLALAICFTIVVAPNVIDIVIMSLESSFYFFVVVFSEILIGLSLGLTVRFFVITLQVAGSIAAQSTSLAQIFGTASIEPLPVIGHFMVIGGLTLAVITGLHVRVAESLIKSYIIFIPGFIPQPNMISDWVVQRVANSFSLAFTLASPFIISSFIYNLALGFINKSMPQLMVAFVGAPAITAGAIILLLFSLPFILIFWVHNLNVFLDTLSLVNP
jgi:flagellar biosynthetic protein FliR